MRNEYEYIIAKKEDAQYVLECMQKLSVELLGYNNVEREEKYIAGAIEDQDEIYIICKKNNEFVGFAGVATYHIENGKRADDTVGLITDILVRQEYRGSEVAYTLLMMSIKQLIEHKKDSAIMVVQSTNPHRFLHYAICDKLISREQYTLDSGVTLTDEILLIEDLDKVSKLSIMDIGKKAVLQRRKNKML